MVLRGSKNTKSSLLDPAFEVPSLYVQAQQRLLPAELGKQPEF